LRDGDRGHWIPFLEWMVTTSCDLACPGCDRFIDHNHNWTESFDDIEKRMQSWSRDLDPDNLTIIGGEPLVHPRIYDIIKLSRKCFDHARVEVYTNGLLLSKKPKLLDNLIKIGNGKISLTFHNKQQKVRDKIEENIQKYIFRNLPWFKISANQWQYKDIIFEYNDTTDGGWYDYRRNIRGALKPFVDNDPETSYRSCGVNTFPIIYDGRLYKCPPISMLRTHLEKYNMLDDEDWQPYIKYKGIGEERTETEIEEFVDNIFKPNPICGMCPANPVLKPQEEAVLKHSIEKL